MTSPIPPREIGTDAGGVGGGLERLIAIHAEARRSGRAALAVLHSPWGGGSDALLKEWRRWLLGERETTFEGHCTPEGATYRPLREIISRYVRTLDDLGLVDDEVATSLAVVAHSLGMAAVGAPRKPGPLSAPEQLAFFESVGRVLGALSRRLPAVLLIHERHAADSATSAALDYLLENVVTDPVSRFAPDAGRPRGFVGTVIVTMSEATGAFERLRERLDRRENAHFISLREVEEEQVRRHLASDDVVRRLMLATGGSLENLRELLGMLPRRVEDLYARRLEHLDPPTRAVLEALAVLGRATKPDLLLRIAEVGDQPPSLATMADQRLIVRNVTRGELLVDFPSASNRNMLYQGIDTERRELLHARVAQMLEERSRFDETVDIEAIAHHYLHSADLQKATAFALEASERLHISFAWQRARELLELLLPRLAGGDERTDVLERLAELHAALNDHGAALACLDQLATEVVANRRAAVLRRKGEVLLEMGAYDRAMEALDEAARAAEQSGSPDDLVEALRRTSVEAEVLYGRGLYDAALQRARSGLEQAGRGDEASTIREALRLQNTVGKVLLFQGAYDEATQAFHANRARARAAGLGQEEVRALFNLGTIALQRRDYDAAERMLEECVAFGPETSHPTTRAALQLNLAVAYHKTLRYADALDAYLSSLATFGLSGNDLQYAVCAMNLGSLYETLGDEHRARELLKTSIDITSRREIRYFLGRALYVRGHLDLSLGRFGEAETALREAEEVLGRGGGGPFAERVRLGRAHAAHGLGDRRLRDELMRQGRRDVEGAEAVEIAAEQALLAGRFALDDGDVRRAVALLTEALERFDGAELHERVALTRFHLARAQETGGEISQALATLRRAADLWQHIAQQVPETLRRSYLGEATRQAAIDAIRRLESAPRTSVRRPTATDEAPRNAEQTRWRAKYARIVGEDPRLTQIFRLIDRVAQSDSTVLIQGESGTGKELIAEAIHRESDRSGGPFIKVNCAAFVETLLLSELFGHERGAFTGALARKKGRFELADGGTLFLDEIGDISANTQVALLRVLQERRFERVGGSETVETNVRLIVATNRNLEEMVRAGTFRLDLYYRLKGVVLELPALRDRRGDVALLVEHFCRSFSSAARPRRFSRAAIALLQRYPWPGNIRELENFVRSMLLFVDDTEIDVGHVLQFEDFFTDASFLHDAHERADLAEPASVSQRPETRDETRGTGGFGPSTSTGEYAPAAASETTTESIATWALSQGIGLHDLKDRLERELIRRALLESSGNITHAARMLDMKRPRLSQIVNADPELEALRARLAGSDDTGSG